MYHCLLTVLDMPFLTRHLSTSITYVERDVKKYNKEFWIDKKNADGCHNNSMTPWFRLYILYKSQLEFPKGSAKQCFSLGFLTLAQSVPVIYV